MRGQFGDSPELRAEKAWAHMIPVPLEQTVSYGGGTASGPGAILEASYQLENYDREFGCEPATQFGIYTHPELELAGAAEAAHVQIYEAVRECYRKDRLLGILGGEHSLTGPAVRAVCDAVKEPITVVQLDAHADLRDEYEGSKLSHASVSRRLLELPQVTEILQLGVRSLCTEEADVIASESRVTTWFVEDVREGKHLTPLLNSVRGKNVYLTLDVDCFDPSIMASTGTPEPNGFSYSEAEDIVRRVMEVSNLVAFDCVELAPRESNHAPDFTIAKFLYRLLSVCWFLRQTNH